MTSPQFIAIAIVYTLVVFAVARFCGLNRLNEDD